MGGVLLEAAGSLEQVGGVLLEAAESLEQVGGVLLEAAGSLEGLLPFARTASARAGGFRALTVLRFVGIFV